MSIKYLKKNSIIANRIQVYLSSSGGGGILWTVIKNNW